MDSSGDAVFYESIFPVSRDGHFKLIVGPQGQTILSTMQLSGAKLDIRRSALQVVVQGTRAQINVAVAQLEDILAEVTRWDYVRQQREQGQAKWEAQYGRLRKAYAECCQRGEAAGNPSSSSFADQAATRASVAAGGGDVSAAARLEKCWERGIEPPMELYRFAIEGLVSCGNKAAARQLMDALAADAAAAAEAAAAAAGADHTSLVSASHGGARDNDRRAPQDAVVQDLVVDLARHGAPATAFEMMKHMGKSGNVIAKATFVAAINAHLRSDDWKTRTRALRLMKLMIDAGFDHQEGGAAAAYEGPGRTAAKENFHDEGLYYCCLRRYLDTKDPGTSMDVLLDMLQVGLEPSLCCYHSVLKVCLDKGMPLNKGPFVKVGQRIGVEKGSAQEARFADSTQDLLLNVQVLDKVMSTMAARGHRVDAWAVGIAIRVHHASKEFGRPPNASSKASSACERYLGQYLDAVPPGVLPDPQAMLSAVRALGRARAVQLVQGRFDLNACLQQKEDPSFESELGEMERCKLHIGNIPAHHIIDRRDEVTEQLIAACTKFGFVLRCDIKVPEAKAERPVFCGYSFVTFANRNRASEFKLAFSSGKAEKVLGKQSLVLPPPPHRLFIDWSESNNSKPGRQQGANHTQTGRKQRGPLQRPSARS
jgi:hypothetical protein